MDFGKPDDFSEKILVGFCYPRRGVCYVIPFPLTMSCLSFFHVMLSGRPQYVSTVLRLARLIYTVFQSAFFSAMCCCLIAYSGALLTDAGYFFTWIFDMGGYHSQ